MTVGVMAWALVKISAVNDGIVGGAQQTV